MSKTTVADNKARREKLSWIKISKLSGMIPAQPPISHPVFMVNPQTTVESGAVSQTKFCDWPRDLLCHTHQTLTWSAGTCGRFLHDQHGRFQLIFPGTCTPWFWFDQIFVLATVYVYSDCILLDPPSLISDLLAHNSPCQEKPRLFRPESWHQPAPYVSTSIRYLVSFLFEQKELQEPLDIMIEKAAKRLD